MRFFEKPQKSWPHPPLEFWGFLRLKPHKPHSSNITLILKKPQMFLKRWSSASKNLSFWGWGWGSSEFEVWFGRPIIYLFGKPQSILIESKSEAGHSSIFNICQANFKSADLIYKLAWKYIRFTMGELNFEGRGRESRDMSKKFECQNYKSIN